MKLLAKRKLIIWEILASKLRTLFGMRRRARRRKMRLLLQAEAKSSSSLSRLVAGEDVHEVVVEAVNRLGGIKRAKTQDLLDELINYDDLNLLDVYKHMQILKKATTAKVAGNETWTESTSETKLFGENQASSTSTANKDVVRENFMAKEIENHLEAKERMWQFCTLFPQHHEFDKDTLIQLWIAAGFIKGEHKDDIGDFYFRILLRDEYIINTRTWSLTEKDMYKVNMKKMEDDPNIMLNKKLYLRLKDLYDHEASEEVQYVSLVGEEIDETSLEKLTYYKDLKALMLLSEDVSSIRRIPQDIFSHLKHLEVLDFSGTNISELPNSIGNLLQLKYLDLSLTLIESLPETLDCLSSLQTLKLRDCRRLFRLPEGMKKLTSLKHLELDILGQLAFMPRGIGALTKLEILSAFVVHKDDGRSIKELRNMNNLKERFCIARLENVSNSFDVEKAALYKKEYLKELELRWSDDLHQSMNMPHDQDEILKELRPHSNLEQLQISCYGGMTFPSWVGNPSHNMLTTITLFKCGNAEILPCLGQLPSLKFLSLVEMNSVTEIGTEFRGFDTLVAFPQLERLAIIGFTKLEIWKEAEVGDYPSLRKLTIERCPNLIEVPSTLLQLYTLKHLELISCTNLPSLLEKKLSTSLKTLIVEECPKTTEWLKRKGKDRHNKIEHVQNVWVDQKLISKN